MLCGSGAYGWRISDQISSSGQAATFALALACGSYRFTGATSSSLDMFALSAFGGSYGIIGAASVTDPDVVMTPSAPRVIVPMTHNFVVAAPPANLARSVGLVFKHGKRK